MSDEEMNYEKTRETIADILVPKGKGCGKKIAKVLRERGYENVIPLYRSAIVISIDEGERGVPFLSIKSFGDPHFMGADEINDSTVSDKGHEYIITGSRSGIRIHDALQEEKDGRGKMMTKSSFEFIKEIDEKRKERDEG